MTVQDDIHCMAALLGLGAASDQNTEWFAGKKHDDLLDKLKDFLIRHRNLLGHDRTVIIQGLNDRGVDLLVELPSAKVGFQLKSPWDVEQNDFSSKVKAQLADSFGHNLDKWIVLVCAPMTKLGRPNRIRHLLSEMSSWKTDYHAIYAPEECIQFFCDAVVRWEDYQLRLGRLGHSTSKHEEILSAIRTLSGSDSTTRVAAPSLLEKQTETVIPTSFSSFLSDLDEEHLQEVAAAVARALTEFARLPREHRELFATILMRAESIICRGYGAFASEIEAALNVDASYLVNFVNVLAEKRFLYIGEEEGPAFFEITNVGLDWDFFADIRKFCELHNIPITKVLVDLDFSVLD